MGANTDYNKIEKVLSKITGKELKEFVRYYALTHDDLATALVEKWRTRQTLWGGCTDVNSKTVAKRYMIEKKLVPFL